jgi:ATP-binding cassette subfamily B protein
MTRELKSVKNKGYRLDRLNAVFGSSTWVSFQTFRFVCIIVTGVLVRRGKIEVGDVLMYAGFFQTIVMSVRMLVDVVPVMATGYESIRSVGEILDCPDIEQNRGKVKVVRVGGDFRFEHVSFRYPSGNRPAIHDLDFHVRKGETVALVGESGAGKSTVMALLIGFRRPTEGRVLLDGVDMATIDLQSYRRHLAVVSQQTILFSGSVRENITYGLRDVGETKLREAIDLANAAEFVDALPDGLDTRLGEHGGKLSGGQRQRIAIARALIRDPRVIVFDEATSSLDVASERLVQEAIGRLIEDRTTFIVAHRLSTVRKADRIFVMEEGRIAETGTHDQLVARRGRFYRLKALQAW